MLHACACACACTALLSFVATVSVRAPPHEASALWANVSTEWDAATWGEWRGKCFHMLGIDVMLDANGAARLLEVNCNPSLGIDTCYVTEGPYAAAPPPPHPSVEALNHAALPLMKGRGTKVCRCRSHHRPHLHRPCPIDLTVKRGCVGGALTIVQRDIDGARCGTTPTLAALADGTSYDPLDSTASRAASGAFSAACVQDAVAAC